MCDFWIRYHKSFRGGRVWQSGFSLTLNNCPSGRNKICKQRHNARLIIIILFFNVWIRDYFKITRLIYIIKHKRYLIKLGNTNDIDMIFAEANALKNLNHKNIVKMLNCYIFKDMRAVFIMEYLKGGDLSDYLIRQPDKCLNETTV